MMKDKVKLLLACVAILIGFSNASGQQGSEIVLEKSLINEIIDPQYYRAYFTDASDTISYTPQTITLLEPAENRVNIENPEKIYWLWIRVRKPDANNWFLEFLDAHTNSIEVYEYISDSLARQWAPMGMDYAFNKKNYLFKNFLFPIGSSTTGQVEFLVKIRSTTKTSFIFKFRTDQDFVSYAKSEYYFLGIFYGIVLITMITNLILFFFLRERVYLYYSLYLLGCGLLFLSEDNFGFEYIWSSMPELNKMINLYAPVFLLICLYLYANRFLGLKNRLSFARTLFFWATVVCVGYFFINALVTGSSADYRFYVLPFVMLYAIGIDLWRKGSRAGRYFVIAHSFMIVGIIFLVFRKAGINILNTPVTYFSMNVGFVFEITILSYALGERIHEFKTLRIKAQEKLLQQLKSRQEAQRKLVEQLEENQKLKDQLNNELELEVQKRSNEIIKQNEIIAAQNQELVEANATLILQADKINQLNEKLDLDNWALKNNIKSITEARILSKNVDFAEFSKLYPDQDLCLKFLAEKKWPGEYSCRKCENTVYCAGRTPYSRRCTKCRYEESATAFTLLHKCKIPLEKAFYAIFLIFSSRGKITSVSMSEKLKIRQSTCWSFMQKINLAMRADKNAWEKGWDSILIERIKPQANIEETQALQNEEL